MQYHYYIVTRSQHAKGSGAAHGPDHYMAVVGVPEGSPWTPSRPLRAACMAHYGVQCWYVGEYYGEHTGRRSTYYQLCLEARDLVARQRQADGYRLASARGGASDPVRGWVEQEVSA